MKEYKFYGVDFKTELKFSVFVGIFLLLMMTLIMILIHQFVSASIGTTLIKIDIAISLLITSLFLLFLGKIVKKQWVLNLNNHHLQVYYGNKEWIINLEQINKITIYGNKNFRYFTLITSTEKIKIRVGTYDLVPFSNKEDIEILESFIKALSPYLKKNLTEIDKRKKISPSDVVKLTYNRKIKNV